MSNKQSSLPAAELLIIKAATRSSQPAPVLEPPEFPVKGFDLRFAWQTVWVPIFDKQIALLREDIARARAEDRAVVYLSCPLSSRGGGFAATNVEIANHTQRRLLREWGHRFWILNPAQYQLESKEGTGLLVRHARELGMTSADIAALPRPEGGDYMRMWTKVLVEDADNNEGSLFDAYYFLGPTDVREFLTQGGALSVTAGVEEFFARQFAMDVDFRDAFSVPGIRWDPDWTKSTHSSSAQQAELRALWEDKRKAFFRYYAIRASVAFSLGSHDEWNIFRLLNIARLRNSKGDVGGLIAGYFDGRQIDPGAAVTVIDPGYAR